MGSAVPYALAAKLAFPDRPVFALVGDGAMQMNGINELITIAKYWRRWSDPRFVVLVLTNRDLNMVTWEQRAMAGDPKLRGVAGPAGARPRPLRRALRPARHPRRAPGGGRPGVGRGAAADRPVVIDALCDPEVPPLPPHVTLEQARNFARRCSRATPERRR